jgi:hypothetical protein
MASAIIIDAVSWTTIVIFVSPVGVAKDTVVRFQTSTAGGSSGR